MSPPSSNQNDPANRLCSHACCSKPADLPAASAPAPPIADLWAFALKVTMELQQLIQAIRQAERFLHQQYHRGSSDLEGVTWEHNPPGNDALLWVRRYSGSVTLAPDADLSQIHIYYRGAPTGGTEMVSVEFPIWMDGGPSDLTVECDFDAETNHIHIRDIHVL